MDQCEQILRSQEISENADNFREHRQPFLDKEQFTRKSCNSLWEWLTRWIGIFSSLLHYINILIHAHILNILACLVPGKNNLMFLLASLKTLTNSKTCFESRIKILFRLSFALTGRFYPVYNYIHGRLSEQFEDHWRLSE